MAESILIDPPSEDIDEIRSVAGLQLTTSQKGRLAELYFKAECVKRRIILSKPVIEGGRYDYVMDDGNSLKRVQVKWADGTPAKCANSIIVSLAKPRGKRSNKLGRGSTIYTGADIDLLIAFLPKINKFVALGPEIFGGKPSLHLRLMAPINKQKKKIRYAADHVW